MLHSSTRIGALDVSVDSAKPTQWTHDFTMRWLEGDRSQETHADQSTARRDDSVWSNTEGPSQSKGGQSGDFNTRHAVCATVQHQVQFLL